MACQFSYICGSEQLPGSFHQADNRGSDSPVGCQSRDRIARRQLSLHKKRFYDNMPVNSSQNLNLVEG